MNVCNEMLADYDIHEMLARRGGKVFAIDIKDLSLKSMYELLYIFLKKCR